MSFKPLPGGADFPNRAVLEKRYPKRPLARTAGLRVRRKTSFRGYIGWLPSLRPNWRDTMERAAEYYRAAYVDFVPENGIQVEEFSVTDLIADDEYKKTVESILKASGSPYQNLDAQLSWGYVWPYLHHPHYGIPPRAGDLASFRTWLSNGFLDTGWRSYRTALRQVPAAQSRLGRRNHYAPQPETYRIHEPPAHTPRRHGSARRRAACVPAARQLERRQARVHPRADPATGRDRCGLR